MPAASPATVVDQPEDPAERRELPGELRDLFKEITEFLDSAEKNVSAHPATSVVAAMLLGMLIGLLLGRR
jgi:ElaB/YqjD/DUF883 family membrane-anchored ribosome-binding protein